MVQCIVWSGQNITLSDPDCDQSGCDAGLSGGFDTPTPEIPQNQRIVLYVFSIKRLTAKNEYVLFYFEP